jgi:hypothetical protein
MRRLWVCACALFVLMLLSHPALGFHDSMPKEIYAKLHGYGVEFIEYDGPVLTKQGCPNVRRALLKRGPVGKTLGIGLFVSENETAERLIGAEIRERRDTVSFVWRSPDFWTLASCHFPDKYGDQQAR